MNTKVNVSEFDEIINNELVNYKLAIKEKRIGGENMPEKINFLERLRDFSYFVKLEWEEKIEILIQEIIRKSRKNRENEHR